MTATLTETTTTTALRPTPAMLVGTRRPAVILSARERWEARLAELLAELGIDPDGLVEAVVTARRNPLLRRYDQVRRQLAPNASQVDQAEGLLTLRAIEGGAAAAKRYERTGTRAPARKR